MGGDQVKVKGCYVKVPNLGYVKMAEAIPYGGKIDAMTISKRADNWYVSFSLDVEVREAILRPLALVSNL